jgi:hypothetical protein
MKTSNHCNICTAFNHSFFGICNTCDTKKLHTCHFANQKFTVEEKVGDRQESNFFNPFTFTAVSDEDDNEGQEEVSDDETDPQSEDVSPNADDARKSGRIQAHQPTADDGEEQTSTKRPRPAETSTSTTTQGISLYHYC